MGFFYSADVLVERMRMTEKQSEKLDSTIEFILKIFNKIRHYGLHSLESDYKNIEPEFVFRRKFVQIILQSADIESGTKILEYYILTGNYQGYDLVYRLLYLEALSAIFQYESPIAIEEKLLSVCGEKFREEYRKRNQTGESL
ncbi:MAG: hypothetical protein KDK54_12535 [Leptospiraceae bacterium]|nr:hypothetical protein [Leptospiraceae bacterium]